MPYRLLLLLGLVVAAGACGSAAAPTAPGAPALRETRTNDSGAGVLSAPGDSIARGPWIGSGGS
jgi:hypothetical protein